MILTLQQRIVLGVIEANPPLTASEVRAEIVESYGHRISAASLYRDFDRLQKNGLIRVAFIGRDGARRFSAAKVRVRVMA